MTCPKCSAQTRLVDGERYHNGGCVMVYVCLNGHTAAIHEAAPAKESAPNSITKEEMRREQISDAMKTYLGSVGPAARKRWSARMTKARHDKKAAS